jgi:ornithine--oxo-acid transaminase
VLGLLKPGQHGSTFGGNPLACAVERASLKVLVEEDMIGNAREMGQYFLDELKKIYCSDIKEIRGWGLMIAVELKEDTPGGARDICKKLMAMGILDPVQRNPCEHHSVFTSPCYKKS